VTDVNKPSKRDGRHLIAWWCLYDWGSSAVPAVIGIYVFAPYFTQQVAVNEITGTGQWGAAVTVSALIVAVSSPILGAIADRAGRRSAWLAVFTLVSVAACGLLWFVEPVSAWTYFALVIFAVANLGSELSAVFYNSMLPSLAPANRVGRISGWGWGIGNAGALAALALVWLGFARPDQPFWDLDRAVAEHLRAAGPVTALWYLAFGLPLLLLFRERAGPAADFRHSIARGLGDTMAMLADIRRHANLARYLFARMLYTDGMTTLLVFAGIYAAGTIGMQIDEVLLLGIALNAAAGVGAAGFGWADDRLGPKRVLLFGLGCVIILSVALLSIRSEAWLWGLALPIGFFFGPLYAASRSMMTRLAGEANVTQMFGLYALSGKATAFLGPLAVSSVTLATGSQRAGLATVLVFFVAGLVLLAGVREGPVGVADSGPGTRGM
jgi:UMF1 family MFS transporter